MEATPERLAAWIDKLNSIADDMERFENAAEFPEHIDSITSYLQAKRDEIIMRGPLVELKNQVLSNDDLVASLYEQFCSDRSFRQKMAETALMSAKKRGSL